MAIFMALALMGCSHGQTSSSNVFPFGTYHHQVKVQRPGEATLNLQGVIVSRPREWRLSVLSPAGTTLFRVHNDSIENFTTEIPSARVKNLNAWIQRFMFADRDRSDFQFEGASFSLKDPDERQIPRQILIHHPHAEITVRVLSYQLR